MARVVVKGLAELRRAFRQMGGDLPKDLRRELRSIAQEVSTEAKSVARSQGLVAGGALVGQIRPSVRGAAAYVRANARNRGFPYPAIYEGLYRLKKPSGGRTARPFLEPALEAKQGRIVERLEDMLERLTARAGF